MYETCQEDMPTKDVVITLDYVDYLDEQIDIAPAGSQRSFRLLKPLRHETSRAGDHWRIWC